MICSFFLSFAFRLRSGAEAQEPRSVSGVEPLAAEEAVGEGEAVYLLADGILIVDAFVEVYVLESEGDVEELLVGDYSGGAE